MSRPLFDFIRLVGFVLVIAGTAFGIDHFFSPPKAASAESPMCPGNLLISEETIVTTRVVGNDLIREEVRRACRRDELKPDAPLAPATSPENKEIEL